jgi:GNAT superfamily N-acetyltransferase
MTRLVQPQSTADWREARRLIEAYATSLDVDLSFQDFDHELHHLTSEYAPPTGAFLLAEECGREAWIASEAAPAKYVGCVGLRHFAEGVGEIKRLYIVPAARGLGVGRLLADGIAAAARRLGYARLVLDTLPSMSEARALYASLGFTPIAAYRFNPVPGTAFLELEL